MRSTLARGHVRHRRTIPRAYDFSYGVYYVHLDLHELPEVDRRIRLFSYNRPNVMSFRDDDHMASFGEPISVAVRTYLQSQEVDPDEIRVSLLTNTRILGYVFNPVSFYFVRDRASDALRLVIAEVHNTHGEEHLYTLARDSDAAIYRSSAEKKLYVSPFIEMAARYEFECRELPGRAYDLRIDEYDPDSDPGERTPFFQAQLLVRPLPLSNANVAMMLIRYPLMTLRTIALIHWQGLKLWLRGVRYFKHEPQEEKT